ncbi:MAG: NAD-dependent succinate-semialdehyde dehydrogenase [Melioribacteraceae bacterium]|nr:NAD-dependent succinate-semialdehyde dehydrogenase [Melioribacteraceae bacterium]MCF8353656.1 NAD-dependent succinate-semialdehyde dehydrogenase [Melioribacteraceae bacterium]MCF8393426.1 NAD-dependent succinate-semialdehyde dehydrogenase [Melioribacteraceae bacterium]MCF8419283.1 NAD-dependent succinate-semialdehyde dehydrogenase [Melioribacteraceae bacterium]
MALKSINPATNELIEKFNELSKDELLEKIEKAQQTFLDWKKTTFKDRKEMMLKAAEELRSGKDEYAKTLTLEMGKPVKQSYAEVEKCAWVCEYYAENAETILKKEIIETDASESFVRFDPVGIVLAVMPWNFPYWQVFRFAAPALMAGNVGLLKHASNVPKSALAIEKVFKRAGFPEGAFTTLLIGSRNVEFIINHKDVKAATLTGSENAGKEVATRCGAQLKKTVMELGGSDPFIILADADLEKAAEVGVTARLINNGQSCIAAKRFIVVEEVYNKFENMFRVRLENVKVGDPMEEETELGPLAREDLLIELDGQVRKSIIAGAKVITGGKRINRPGNFYQPTLLSNVKKGMVAYGEELFGPVAIFIKAKDENDAVAIANDSEFGLGASLWTRDTDKAKKIAAEIEAGSVFINGLVKSDPRLPFGGIKISGYGRELSHYGIKEFVNIKTVWVA